MRILVTGSRNWTDENVIREALREAAPGGLHELVHGAARGADSIAARIAFMWGWQVSPFPVTDADWRKYGRRAGMRRNAEMVRLGADVCLAFIDECGGWHCPRLERHGSHGASLTADLAERAGIPVRRYERTTRDG